MCFRLCPETVQALLAQVVGEGRTLGDIAQEWQRVNHVAQDCMDSCLQLWAPHALAIAAGQWEWVALRDKARIERGCSAFVFLARQNIEEGVVPAGIADSETPLSPDGLRDLAEQFRQCAEIILDGRPCVDPAGFRELLELDVVTLEKLADEMEAVTAANMEGFGKFGSQRRYNICFLLQAFMMSRTLRKGAVDLKQSLQLALRIALPKSAADYFVRSLECRAMPSPAIVSHFSLVLDVGFMLWMRKRLTMQMQEHALTIHWKVDSSTQGGIDWENTEYTVIYNAESVEFLQSYRSLVPEARANMARQDADEDAVEREKGLIMRMCEIRQHHHGVPAGLSSKRGDLMHKAHAVLHSIYLETGSAKDLRRFLDATVSITGDLGVEKGLPMLPPYRFSQLFPDYQCGDIGDDEGFGEAAPDELLSMRHILYCPGLLHVISNASKDLLQVTQHFKPVYDMMEAVTLWLHDKATRDHFVATCCSTPPFVHLKPLFMAFPHTLVGWRWEHVWRAASALLDIKDALCSAWNADRMAGRFRDEHDLPADVPIQYQNHGVRLQRATQGVRSELMWGYLVMVNMFGELLQHLCHWAESCPCHGGRAFGAVGGWGAARRKFAQRISSTDPTQRCPAVGCRMAEVACGDFHELVGQVHNITAAQLVVVMPPMSAQHRVAILTDFDRIKTYLVSVLHCKMRPMTVLPRRLLGLSHWDEGKARNAGRSALQQWHAIEVGPGNAQALHPLTLQFLHPGSPLRQQLEQYVDGTSLSELPELQMQISKFALSSSTERSIEAKHAHMHKELLHAPRASAPVLSLADRLPEIVQHLRQSPEMLVDLAEHLRVSYHPINAVSALGLEQHPECVAALHYRQNGEVRLGRTGDHAPEFKRVI